MDFLRNLAQRGVVRYLQEALGPEELRGTDDEQAKETQATRGRLAWNLDLHTWFETLSSVPLEGIVLGWRLEEVVRGWRLD